MITLHICYYYYLRARTTTSMVGSKFGPKHTFGYSNTKIIVLIYTNTIIELIKKWFFNHN